MKNSSLRKLLLTLPVAAGLSFLGAGSASATLTAQCPSISFSEGCNVLITLGTGGSAGITVPNAYPYDGVEDQLVGVQNNTGGTLNSITLSGSFIFGFDGDGAGSTFPSGYSFVGPYGIAAGAPFGPTGYEGPGTSFSIADYNNGTVNFLGGIANGGSAWFSLEEPPSVGGFSITSVQTSAVPEPGTLLLLGSGLSMMYYGARRKKG